MSIIIAIKEKNKIVMGCDSQVSSGGLKEQLVSPSAKVVESMQSKDILIGGVGSLRDVQIIQSTKDLIPEINILKDTVDTTLIINEVTMNIYNRLKKFNRVDIEDGNYYSPNINSSFIIAYRDKAWLISNDLGVLPIEDYLVCGSGEQVSIGVLENTKDLPAVERIKQAIKVSSDKTLYVDNNINILHT